MMVFKDRVKDSSTSTGAGNFTLAGIAPLGFQSFAAAFTLTDSFEYCISDTANGFWETGAGHLASPTSLVRDTAHDGSSGTGVFVNFTAGIKAVFCTPTAQYMESSDKAQALSTINAAARLIQTQIIMAQMVSRGQTS